jgi:hypothetical protein
MTVQIVQMSSAVIPNGRVVPFNAGDFTGKGAMTWTVAAGQVNNNTVVFAGKMMWWWLAVAATTIGGVLNNQLFIKLPFNRTVARLGGQIFFPCTVSTGGGFPENDLVQPGDFDSTHISITRSAFANFPAGATNFFMWPLCIEVV